MAYSMNAGWGRLIAESLKSRPRVGKILLVAAATNVNWEELNEIFAPTDKVQVLTTLSLALTQATASEDDVIFIAPYHTESITAAAGIAMSKAGVSVIGLGQGTSRPTFTWSTAVGASWDVSGADCLVENCLFDLTGIDAITAGFNITASDFNFKNCEVITATSTAQAVVGILTSAAGTGLVLEDDYFRGSQTAGTVSALRIVGGNNQKIKNSTFIGNYKITAGAIEVTTTAAGSMVIQNNTILNTTPLSTAAMNFFKGSTAIVAGNILGIKSGTAPIKVGEDVVAQQGGGYVLDGGNYYKNSSNVVAGTLF